MTLVSNEVFAITVKGELERVRLRVQEEGSGKATISTEPKRGDVGEGISLAAIKLIACELDNRGIMYRALERRAPRSGGTPSFVVEGVVIPEVPSGLVGELLTRVTVMGTVNLH